MSIPLKTAVAAAMTICAAGAAPAAVIADFEFEATPFLESPVEVLREPGDSLFVSPFGSSPDVVLQAVSDASGFSGAFSAVDLSGATDFELTGFLVDQDTPGVQEYLLDVDQEEAFGEFILLRIGDFQTDAGDFETATLSAFRVVETAVIPLPASGTLLLGGLGVLAMRRRR